MSIKIQTTNTPVDDNGNGDLIEVDDAEFIDLTRMGLVVKGKGDVHEDGTLKRTVVKDVSPQVLNTTGQQPTIAKTEG